MENALIAWDHMNVYALMDGLESDANKKLPFAQFNAPAKMMPTVLIFSKISSAFAQVELMENNVKLHQKDVLEILACIMENAVILGQDLTVLALKISQELDVNTNLTLVSIMFAKMVPHAMIQAQATLASVHQDLQAKIVKMISLIAKIILVHQERLALI